MVDNFRWKFKDIISFINIILNFNDMADDSRWKFRVLYYRKYTDFLKEIF